MESPNGPFKKMPEVVITEQDTEALKDTPSQPSSKDDWATGVRKRMPWLGIGAISVVILASLGQLLILYFANGRSATQWPDYITPNVCLSILNGIATLAITLAVGQGIAIAWWRKALLGASIKELHYGWSFSASVSSIFLKYKYFNVIALAALMAKVAIIDGILFQRAIGTYIDIGWEPSKTGFTGDTNVHAWSQTDFPVTGIMGAHNLSEGSTEYNFSTTVSNWISIGTGLNYADYITSCLGVGCLYGLPGAGFAIDCHNTTTIENVGDAARSAGNSSGPALFSTSFQILPPDSNKPYSRLEMDGKWPTRIYDEYGNLVAAPNVCPTNFTLAKCEFRPAVMNYTVAYQNVSSVELSKMAKLSKDGVKGDTETQYSGSTLTYSCNPSTLAFGHVDDKTYDNYDDLCGYYDSTWRQMKGVQVVRNQDLNETFVPGMSSSLLGIYNVLRDTFASEAHLEYNNGSGWSVSQSGVLSAIAMETLPPTDSYCNYSYLDPTYTIFTRLNALMLQASVSYSLYPNIISTDENGTILYNQNQQAEQFFKDIYYATDYRYAGVALGLTLFVIFCILPSYWGFWQLGRNVTLGPFEIAYAFQGPAFSSVNGVNGHADQVVKTVGRTRVQYGEVEEGDRKRLAFKMEDITPSRV